MRECEAVQFGIKTLGGEVEYVRAFTVPFICDQLNKQPIDPEISSLQMIPFVMNNCLYISSLELIIIGHWLMERSLKDDLQN